MPRIIDNVEQLQSLLANRPDKSGTYKVSEQVARVVSQNNGQMRQMTEAEIQELADYFDIQEASELKGPFYIHKHFTCSYCSRKLTFTDFVSTVFEAGSCY